MTKEERIEKFKILDKYVDRAGITYYELSKKLGFSNVVFSEWKKGKAMPKLDKLIRIADYLGIDLRELAS